MASRGGIGASWFEGMVVVEYPTDSCGGGLAMVEGKFQISLDNQVTTQQAFKKTQEASAGLAKRKARTTADPRNSYSNAKPFNDAGDLNPLRMTSVSLLPKEKTIKMDTETPPPM